MFIDLPNVSILVYMVMFVILWIACGYLRNKNFIGTGGFFYLLLAMLYLAVKILLPTEGIDKKLLIPVVTILFCIEAVVFFVNTLLASVKGIKLTLFGKDRGAKKCTRFEYLSDCNSRDIFGTFVLYVVVYLCTYVFVV